ncbi:MAG TPA: hypothetical protein VGC07_07415 [Granulicella sp.]
MTVWEYLGLGLVLWTVIGIVGTTIAAVRRERQRVREGILALVGAWVLYVAALGIVSGAQPERRVPAGQPVCYGAMCFTVVGVRELPGTPRLVQVTVRIENRSRSSAGRESIRADLRDGQGRLWSASRGVSGNPLDVRVLPGAAVVSQPVFPLPADASVLGLVLEHEGWSTHRLAITDAESLWHRPQVMLLGR